MNLNITDKDRIDFLSAYYSFGLDCDENGKNIEYLIFDELVRVVGRGKTLRLAIDNAINDLNQQ